MLFGLFYLVVDLVDTVQEQQEHWIQGGRLQFKKSVPICQILFQNLLRIDL